MTFHFLLQYYKNIDYILFTVNRQFLQLVFSKCSTSMTYSYSRTTDGAIMKYNFKIFRVKTIVRKFHF